MWDWPSKLQTARSCWHFSTHPQRKKSFNSLELSSSFLCARNSFALTGLVCFVCDTRAVEESHYHSHQCHWINVFKIHGVDNWYLFAFCNYKLLVYIFIPVIGDSLVDPSSLQQLELSVAVAMSKSLREDTANHTTEVKPFILWATSSICVECLSALSPVRLVVMKWEAQVQLCWCR